MANLKKRYHAFLYFNLVLILLIPVSILFFDQPVSNFTAKYLVAFRPFFNDFTFQFDQLSFHILKLLLFMACAGLLSLIMLKNKLIGIVLLSIFVTHLTATGFTNILKSKIKRSRPTNSYVQSSLRENRVDNLTTDYSFPSAHTSFYLSLFLPAALVFRRYAILLLAIPAIIISGRIVLNVHFLSDVLCSILIVNVLSYLSLVFLFSVSRKIFKKWYSDTENLIFKNVLTKKK